MAVLPKRFGRFKLAIHLKNSRLMEFKNPDVRWNQRVMLFAGGIVWIGIGLGD